jgi:hypothetical protein
MLIVLILPTLYLYSTRKTDIRHQQHDVPQVPDVHHR